VSKGQVEYSLVEFGSRLAKIQEARRDIVVFLAGVAIEVDRPIKHFRGHRMVFKMY